MLETYTVSFVIEPLSHDQPVPSIVPAVNGIRLTDLVAEFEGAHQYEPSGGYAGLVPAYFKFGPLDEYFLGRGESPVFGQSYYLLGCECGEVGCWPLQAKILTAEREVKWQDFRQPFRSERDYSSFGPFRFDIEQYRQAVNELASTFRIE